MHHEDGPGCKDQVAPQDHLRIDAYFVCEGMTLWMLKSQC